MRYGIRLIDSMPPASTTVDSPSRMVWAADAMACRPEAQALLMVWAGDASGTPARRPTWRPGFGPAPACRAWPMTISSMSAGVTPARLIAARAATAPNSAGCRSRSDPPNFPIGVRAAPRMRTSGVAIVGLAIRVDLRALQTPAEVDVHRFPLRKHVKRGRTGLPMTVAGLFRAAKGQMHFGADGRRVHVKDARIHVAHRPKGLVHILRVNR